LTGVAQSILLPALTETPEEAAWLQLGLRRRVGHAQRELPHEFHVVSSRLPIDRLIEIVGRCVIARLNPDFRFAFAAPLRLHPDGAIAA